MNKFVSISENFLDEEMFSTFNAFAQSTKMYDLIENDTFWNKKVVHLNSVFFLSKVTKQYARLLRDKLISEFNIEHVMYFDLLCVTRWLENTGHDLHAPSENLDGTPSVLPWRDYGCILFLNDDFVGGDIEFPKQNIRIKPKPNTLIIYPGDAEFVHKKHVISTGTRYIIDSFWTKDKSKQIEL
jgi:hypothetical protein